MKPFLLLAISALAVLPCAGSRADTPSGDEDTDRFRIHVITVGPGEELFTRFGHIALLVQDRTGDRDLVYNFGTFDFDDPELRFRYARGFLNYWLSTSGFGEFMSYQAATNRDVWISTLDLPPDRAERVARRLQENALPAHRYYAYRHYLDNCCTRIRDLIDAETDGAIAQRFRTQKVNRDFRYWTAWCLRGLPLYQSVILYSLGPAIDQPLTRWDEQFLPEVLFEDLNKVRLPDGKPLVGAVHQVLRRKGPPIGESIPALDLAVLALLGLLVLAGFAAPAILGRRKAAARLLGLGLTFWGLLAGLGGLMLLLYWTVTTHYDTHYNENLLINPVTHLWLVGPGLALLIKGRLTDRTAAALQWYFVASFGLIAVDLLLKLGPFIQGNAGAIALAILCNGAALLGLWRTGIISRLLPTLRQTNR